MRSGGILAIALIVLAGPAAGQAVSPDELVPGPTAADWAAIARLPDLSGTWLPDIADQKRQERGADAPLWYPEIR
jgi:hypothetical protein